MNARIPAPDTWYPNVEKTSQTDDQRIQEITVLPPPEHLIRFFPIQNTPSERLISDTRRTIGNIMHGRGDDRLLVIVGPCSIHDPAAALDYARLTGCVLLLGSATPDGWLCAKITAAAWWRSAAFTTSRG